MWFDLDPASGVPLYRQLADQFRQRIVGGRLPAGGPLPSVRDLAARLKINPLTVARVYQLLESEGLLESRRGVGTFVAAKPGVTAAARAKLLEPALAQFLAAATGLGLSAPEIQRLVRDRLQEHPPEKTHE